MKASTLLSEFITSDQLKESGPQTFTIKDWEIGEFKDKETGKVAKKLVLIVDEDRKLSLNKTNTRTLIEEYGTEETDEWIGRVFEAYYDPDVTFMSKKTGGTVVRG